MSFFSHVLKFVFLFYLMLDIIFITFIILFFNIVFLHFVQQKGKYDFTKFEYMRKKRHGEL
jgi:hypothetical protein